MSPRMAYVLGLDWADWDAPSAPFRWFSRGALTVTGCAVLAAGGYQLVRAEWRRRFGRRA